MEGKMIWGIIANLVGWPLIIYWLAKSNKNTKESKKQLKEYDKPENKFKRDKIQLKLSISKFANRAFYPYILEPSFDAKQKVSKAKYITDKLDPYTFKEINQITKGKTEDYFYFELCKRFGIEKIFLGNHSLYGFYPDILYIDNAKKIYIDIEIDEPYSLKTGEPIHYWHVIDSSEGKKFLDDKNKERDNAFVKYGWSVLRFSENQVFDSVQACCDIVDYLVNYLSLISTRNNLEKIDIKIQKRWTKDEAIQMSTEKSRQNGESIQLEYTKFSIEEFLDSKPDET